MKLSLYERLRMRNRLFRYRFKSERPSIEFVLASRLIGTTVLDIGANFGVYSYYLSKAVGRDGRLFAFEPQPELGMHLEAVKNTYHLDNLTIVRKGLSSATGNLKMRRSAPGSGGASFHYEPAEELEEIDVPVSTIDEYLSGKSCPIVSFVKCDVEGHELEAFRGGENTLCRYTPTLLFECHETEARAGKLFAYLADLGYDGCFFYVKPADHGSLLRNNKGMYVHYSEFGDYPYPRESVRHRNYIFFRKGQPPSTDLCDVAALS
jgi:FkbM family methyltransferase